MHLAPRCFTLARQCTPTRSGAISDPPRVLYEFIFSAEKRECPHIYSLGQRRCGLVQKVRWRRLRARKYVRHARARGVGTSSVARERCYMRLRRRRRAAASFGRKRATYSTRVPRVPRALSFSLALAVAPPCPTTTRRAPGSFPLETR